MNGYRTLKSVLADSRVPKVFWDVRQDAAALHWQFRVPIDGIIDCQLKELAMRGQSEGCTCRLLSMTDAIKADAGLDTEELNRVIAIKGEGKTKFFREEYGGGRMFNERPMFEEVVEYCVTDVAYMAVLFEKYNKILGGKISLLVKPLEMAWNGPEEVDYRWESKVLEESKARVVRQRDPAYRKSGRMEYESVRVGL